jgi:hypothetical protein
VPRIIANDSVASEHAEPRYLAALRWFILPLLAVACATADGGRQPTVLNAHALAFDGHEMLLFGGADDRRVIGETWRGRGSNWRLAHSPAPPARTFPSMVYDSTRGVVVLFGGSRVLFGQGFRAENLLADTWIWNGRKWREARVPLAPSPRAEAAIAFDRARGRVVLFGGYTVRNGERDRLGDTWEWDGSRWMLVATAGPSPRNSPAMTWDAGRRLVVLFGGSGATSDTWTWDGASWQQLETNDVPGRFNAAMAYDEERGVVVRFGGWDRTKRTNDTWELYGATWKLVAESGPSPRNHSAMTWDPTRHAPVLFGGHDGDRVFGDSWEWDGRAWRQVRDVPPRPRVENDH